MQNILLASAAAFTPIEVIKASDFDLNEFSEMEQNWLTQHEFQAKSGELCLMPDANGKLAKVLLGHSSAWEMGGIAKRLPAGVYKFVGEVADEQLLALSWSLSQYQYLRYLQKKPAEPRQLLVAQHAELNHMLAATKLVRDLINTPAADMGPVEMAEQALILAKQFSATVNVIVGSDLLEKGFPAIHAVGRAAPQAPRLIELDWQTDSELPLIILVGKGVCFDTGGLNLKPGSGMLGMKKDMGGAANVLGLAHMIMANNLKVRLKVLIPAVENSIGRDAYRPSDILTMRDGSTVEVTNTDAEGRLVLADALSYASELKPDLLVDMATLTGAARVALGTEVAGGFTADAELAAAILRGASSWADPVCFLPLHKGYRYMLDSKIADISNASKTGYAGAITAALFLEKFVQDVPRWVHFDIMAANIKTSAGRPEGGEAMAIRALYQAIQELYCN